MIPMIVKGTRHEADVLTPEALGRSSTLDTGCLNVTVAVYRDLTGERLVRPEGWWRLAHLMRDDEPGTGPVAGPLLVQQGTADALVPEQDTARLVDRLSRHDVSVTYRTYARLDHNGVLIPSSRDALAWIADRFANRPLPTRG